MAAIRLADVPRMFGVTVDDLPDPVPYPLLRQRLRLHYPTPEDFYRWFLPTQGYCARLCDHVTYEDMYD